MKRIIIDEEYKNIREAIELVFDAGGLEAFVKALIGFEYNIDDEKVLDEAYDAYQNDDNARLLSEFFEEHLTQKGIL